MKSFGSTFGYRSILSSLAVGRIGDVSSDRTAQRGDQGKRCANDRGRGVTTGVNFWGQKSREVILFCVKVEIFRYYQQVDLFIFQNFVGII